MIERIYVSEATLQTIERYGQNNLTTVSGKPDEHLCVEFVRAAPSPTVTADAAAPSDEPLPPPSVHAAVHYATWLRREAAKRSDPKADVMRNAARMIDVLRDESRRLLQEMIDQQVEDAAAQPDERAERFGDEIAQTPAQQGASELIHDAFAQPDERAAFEAAWERMNPIDNRVGIKAAVRMGWDAARAASQASTTDRRQAFESWRKREYSVRPSDAVIEWMFKAFCAGRDTGPLETGDGE